MVGDRVRECENAVPSNTPRTSTRTVYDSFDSTVMLQGRRAALDLIRILKNMPALGPLQALSGTCEQKTMPQAGEAVANDRSIRSLGKLRHPSVAEREIVLRLVDLAEHFVRMGEIQIERRQEAADVGERRCTGTVEGSLVPEERILEGGSLTGEEVRGNGGLVLGAVSIPGLLEENARFIEAMFGLGLHPPHAEGDDRIGRIDVHSLSIDGLAGNKA
jgi:hypothetical protein